MKNSPLIYIIVLNYNNTELTIDCLSSLHKMSYPNFKIIVVDDCSEDSSIENIIYSFPKIKLIRNNKNLNYCKSFNVGIKNALDNSAEYIFLVNNDTKDFSIDYLEEAIKTFNTDDNIAMVGSKCIDYDGKERRGKEASMRFGVEMDVPTEGYIIKSEAFKKVGLFNEWLIIYFEDLDYISRLIKAGYKTAINLNITFAHLGGGTTSKVIFKSNYYRVRNMIMFTKKYCTDRSLLVNLKEIRGNLGRHYQSMKFYIQQKSFISALKVIAAVFLGILAGVFTPVFLGWRSKFYKV